MFPADNAARAAHRRARIPSKGHTLIEVLTALAILSAVFAVIWSTFATTLSAWRRGDDVLAGLRCGEYAADEIVAALRASFFNPTRPAQYGFRLGGDPAEGRAILRWISLGGPAAPGPAGIPLSGVARRLTLAVEDDAEGRPMAVLRAAPVFQEEDENEPDPVIRQWPDIVGISCRVWSAAEEQWVTEWKNTNTIPPAVEIVLRAAASPEAEKMDLKRLVELPVHAVATLSATGRRREPERSVRPRQGSEAREAAVP